MTPDPAPVQHCQLGSRKHTTNKCSGEGQLQKGKPGYDQLLEMVYTVGHNDDCLFLCTHLGGLSVDWLMDCGANPNLLSTQLYHTLDEQLFPLTPVRAHLMAANGDKIVTHGQTQVLIELEGTTFEVPVIVADIGTTTGILGMRFLRDNDCVINFRDGVLQCGKLEWDLQGPSAATAQVKLVHRVSLPPCHEAVVAVALFGNKRGSNKQKWEGLVEPCDTFSDCEGVMAPCGLTLVSPSSEGATTAITLSNLSEEKIIIPAGTVIGTIQVAHKFPDLHPGHITGRVCSAQLGGGKYK